MSKKELKDQKSKQQRQNAFDSLPPHIRDSLTPEEKDLFLNSDHWPDTLFNKLEEFIISDH